MNAQGSPFTRDSVRRLSPGNLPGIVLRRAQSIETRTREFVESLRLLKELDSRQALLVWCLWAVLLAWLGSIVYHYGHNLPVCDEWNFVLDFYSSGKQRLAWLIEKHMEHRFPLGRVVFLGVLEATGFNFQAGMFLTVGLLGGASAALMLAARKLRGRTELSDLVFALLFLSHGHTENLFMGYQIVFTITVFCLALFVLAATYSQTFASAKILIGATALLIAISMGGWLGLVFVPPLGLWIAWQQWRTGESGKLRRYAVFSGVALVAVYLAVSLYMLFAMRPESLLQSGPSLSTRLSALVEVMGIGLGPGLGGRPELAAKGAAVIVIQVLAASALAAIGWRRPSERGVAWGLLAVLLGVWAFALSIAFSRGSGFASRYAAFTAFGVAIPFLTIARYAPGYVSSTLMTIVVIVGAVLFFPGNVKHARYQGQFMEQRYREVLVDIDAGMPIDVLALRHVDFWLRTNEAWRVLWEHHFPLIKNAPAPQNGEAVPIHLARDGVARDQLGAFNRYRVELPETRKVAYIRVKFRPGSQVDWESMRFRWNDPVTGETHQSAVYLWVRPLDQSTAFWIDGPLSSGELLMGEEKCPIEILKVEAVLK